jgi:uncharacterized protein RhaS with RHS repeats
LYFYRARYYSPSFQRFIAQDPDDFWSGDINLYSYVSNNPLTFSDPSGRGFINCAAALARLLADGERLHRRLEENENATCPGDPGHEKAINQAFEAVNKDLTTASRACAGAAAELAELAAILAELEGLLLLG